MNTGQTILTVGALAMLSIITLTYYNSIGSAGRTISKNNADFMETTIATSFLERVENCAFDMCADTMTIPVADSTRFSPPSKLGRKSWQSSSDYTTFQWVDDFAGDVITYSPGWMNETYSVLFDVYYVNPWGNNINTKLTTKQSFLKRIDVKVWRTWPPDTTESKVDTVTMSALHGFYFYNPI